MDQVSKKLQEAFYELGVQLGRQLAARLVRRADAETEGAPETRGADRSRRRGAESAARPPPSKPKLLPGLSGRRRLPGEAPPTCGRAGCGKPSRTRGYCQTHYVQWLKATEAAS